MIRIGIIGCGWAGWHHAEAIRHEEIASQMEIVAASEANADTLRKFARDWKLTEDRLYADYRAMLERDDLDAVSVCLPTYLHHEAGLAVVASGRHLLMEKPATITVAEGREVVEAAEKAGLVYMVAESACYSFTAREARRLIAEGAIGRPLLTRSLLTGKFRGSWGNRPWLIDPRQAGGGMFMTNGIHYAALLRHLVGEIEEVFARRVHPDDDPDSAVDTIVASLAYENGAVGEIVTSLNIDRHEEKSGHKVHGTKGTLDTRRGLKLNQGFTLWPEFAPGEPDQRTNPHPERSMFVAEMAHFAECVREGREPLTSGRDQLRALAVIEAGYRSIRTGRPVRTAEL